MLRALLWVAMFCDKIEEGIFSVRIYERAPSCRLFNYHLAQRES